MHINYSQVQIEKLVENKGVQDQIAQNRNNKAVIEETIRNLRDKVKKYQQEQDEIMKTSAIFGTFLKNESMIEYNDAYEEYIKYLIRNEKNKTADPDQEKIHRLEEMMKTYAANKLAIKNSSAR